MELHLHNLSEFTSWVKFFFLVIIFLIEAGPKEMIVFEEEKISRGSFKPEIRLLGKKKKSTWGVSLFILVESVLMCLGTKVSFCVFTSFIGELLAVHICKPSCLAFELQTGSGQISAVGQVSRSCSLEAFCAWESKVLYLLLTPLRIYFLSEYGGINRHHDRFSEMGHILRYQRGLVPVHLLFQIYGQSPGFVKWVSPCLPSSSVSEAWSASFRRSVVTHIKGHSFDNSLLPLGSAGKPAVDFLFGKTPSDPSCLLTSNSCLDSFSWDWNLSHFNS